MFKPSLGVVSVYALWLRDYVAELGLKFEKSLRDNPYPYPYVAYNRVWLPIEDTLYIL